MTPSRFRVCQTTRTFGLLLGLALASAPSPSFAQTTVPPDFGLDWVTVGAPGNAPVPDELFLRTSPPATPLGTVDYQYRIMRTEITVAQWLEFVQAYQPFYTGPPNATAFSGTGISFILGQYVIDNPAEVDFPSTMSWEYAARFCNWLHNGKALTQAAFENGAYDTSTFTVNPDFTRNDQDAHHPDALFWIPTLDEWTKAAYYDPDRFGPGQAGWWYNPGSQDALLISGLPGVGQTNAGTEGGETPVGSYPDVLSPWGLLDTSGGEREWTETLAQPLFKSRTTKSSGAGQSSYDRDDPIDVLIRSGLPTTGFTGLRLASAVQIPACPGDANIDGQVNFADITSALANWLSDGSAGGDGNADGVVDFADITEVLTNWQAACP